MGKTNKDLIKNPSKIPRYENIQRIARKESTPPVGYKERNEIQDAIEQVGGPRGNGTKSWYRDIYEFYQDNEY